MLTSRGRNRGFTLIELSIVLVVIGLIIGGILVGQDLIGAATIRAQISQIEKYNSAANTFKTKYTVIPGDMDATSATQFGFTARTGALGRGDNNGELDGWNAVTGYAWNQDGENLFFWEDLSSAKMIDQAFTAYTDGTHPTCASGTTCANYIPGAKIGNGNFIYTYSGYAAGCCTGNTGIGPNFFGISIITVGSGSNVSTAAGGSSNPGLTVSQAYNIDKKTDDGMPTTGKVMAQYLTPANGQPGWSASGGTPAASTCYDTSTGVAAYSTQINNGANINCGISFQMQGAAR